MRDDKPEETKIEVNQGVRSEPETSTSEDTVDTGGTASPLPVKPVKSNKKWLWLTVFIVAVLAAGVAAWYFLVWLPSTTTKAPDDPLAAATKFSSPKALVDEVEPELKGAVMVVAAADGVSAVTKEDFGIYSAPSYQVPGKKFLNLPEKIEGTGYTGDSVAAEANYKSLVKFFEDNKFKRIDSNENSSAPVSPYANTEYVSYAEYESSNIVCAIRHADASSTALKAHVSSIGCADKASYKAAAEKLQPFYDSYATARDNPGGRVVLGGLSIENGADGYQNAVVYTEDAALFEEGEENVNYSVSGLYFKAPGESKWSFFTGIEDDPNSLYCSEFKDEMLKKAFTGLGCYDEKTQKDSVVKE